MQPPQSGLPLFVVDANALWWYLKLPRRLSPSAEEVFRQAEAGSVVLVVPAIVVAEVYYLSVKLGQPFILPNFLNELATVHGMYISDLGRTQLEMLDRLPEIPEMHDRLIAAEALALGAPVVTRDPVIAASSQVQSIW